MTKKINPLDSLELTLTPKQIGTILGTVFFFAKYPEVVKEDVELAGKVLSDALRAAAGIDE